jgi:hypothetical protein
MAIIIRCTRETGDREGPSINDALVTSNAAATARGKRWLDDPSQGAYYLTKKRDLKVPHKGSNINPGDWITVTDGKLGLNDQKLKVKSYNINITPTGVWAAIETEQYEEFTT